MFRIATAQAIKHRRTRYKKVDLLSDGGKIIPMTCLKLSEETGKEKRLKIEVTPYSFYALIHSTNKSMNRIEKPRENALGTEGVCLYKTSSLQGSLLTDLVGFKVPMTDDKHGSFYYKCNMNIKGLCTTAINLIEFDKAVKNWWTVNTDDSAYRQVLNVAPYEIGLVTSVLQTSKPVELTVELVWIQDTEQNIKEDTPYGSRDAFPQHTETGQCRELKIPADTTLAYQYVQLDVDAQGRINLVFSDAPGTLSQQDMSDALALIPHDAESESFEKGCPVPVLTLSDEHQYELAEENLTRILTRPEVIGLHVCVLSIAGAFRGGKSFILNFFKMFLEGEHVPDWLTRQTSNSSQSFFAWKSGDDAHTKGLILWSKPFVVETANGKVAVLLMDTQGTFDHETNDKDCATIFALSTLLSSTQVFNISRQIQEDHLKSLQFFMEYGKFASKDRETTPFQILHFLIRDYPNNHCPFGFKGGEEYLKKKLKPSMISSFKKTEGDLLREAIKGMFEGISCCLLPRPSQNVQDGEAFDYNNPTKNSSDMKFLSHVQDLVYGLLAPDNLVVKKQSGERLTIETFLIFFKELALLFTKGDMPRLQTVLETTANANNMMAASRSKDAFHSAIQKFASEVTKAGYMANNSFKEVIAEEREKAISDFKKTPKFGGDTYAVEPLADLERDLTNIEQGYRHMLADIPTESEVKQNCEDALNSCMEYHDEEVKQFQDSKKDAETLETDEIADFFETLEKDVVEIFHQHRKIGGIEMYGATLDELRRKMQEAREVCEQDLSTIPTMDQAVRSQVEAYQVADKHFKDELPKIMETEMKKLKVEVESYEKCVEELMNEARETFNTCDKYGGLELETQYMEKLDTCMMTAYNETVDMVKSKARQSATSYKAYTVAGRKYTDIMDTFFEMQKQMITVEESEVENQHHKTLEQCKSEMIRFDPDTPIHPQYLDRLDEECNQKYNEIWEALCHKPSKHQLEMQNTESISECCEQYKTDMLQFVKQKLLKGKCKYEDIPANDASCREKALEKFESSELLGDAKCVEEYRNKLLVGINKCYDEERDYLMKTLPPEVIEKIVTVEREAVGSPEVFASTASAVSSRSSSANNDAVNYKAYSVCASKFTSIMDTDEAHNRNYKLVKQCFVQYLQKMRKEAHCTWKWRGYLCKYSTWFDTRGPPIKKECVDEYNKYCVGSNEVAGQFRAALEKKIDKRFVVFREKKDPWFNLSDRKAMAYHEGEYTMPDEELTTSEH